MSDYQKDKIDQNEEPDTQAARNRRSWIVVLLSLLWVGPCFWLMDQDGYPDSFGRHYHSTTGRGQTAEQYYYSYILIERHHLLDLVTFAYMWAPLLGIIGWIAFRALRRTQFSLHSNDTE